MYNVAIILVLIVVVYNVANMLVFIILLLQYIRLDYSSGGACGWCGIHWDWILCWR